MTTPKKRLKYKIEFDFIIKAFNILLYSRLNNLMQEFFQDAYLRI